jgi:hypothetical protein
VPPIKPFKLAAAPRVLRQALCFSPVVEYHGLVIGTFDVEVLDATAA